MLKWRKPTLKEYIFVVIVFAVITAMLIPTGIFPRSKKTNERMAVSTLINFFSNQMILIKKSTRLYSKEEVLSSASAAQWDACGYELIYESDSISFKLWLVPRNYGQEAETSIYADSLTGDIHGADHQGEKANNTDPVIERVSAETKKELEHLQSVTKSH